MTCTVNIYQYNYVTTAEKTSHMTQTFICSYEPNFTRVHIHSNSNLST